MKLTVKRKFLIFVAILTLVALSYCFMYPLNIYEKDTSVEAVKDIEINMDNSNVKISWESVECAEEYVVYKNYKDAGRFQVRGFGHSIGGNYYETVGEDGFPVARTSETTYIDKRVDSGDSLRYNIVSLSEEYISDKHAIRAIDEGRDGNRSSSVVIEIVN